MGDKLNGEYFEAGAAAFNYNNVTGGADSASGGSGGSAGSGMECLHQLRTPPEPFHYLISEQAKSLVALQELQNEVGALLEFRDLVIETFPNLRSKMPPSTPASSARRDWEPGVRVRRKLAAGTDSARTKPQPSVQDSGFSTETSCGKDAHSSASASATARSRPLEDELLALLDVIHRKGGRLRDEADQLRSEIDCNATAEESFARAMQTCECGDLQRLRSERDALLARAAELEAAACVSPPAAAASAASAASGRSPLGLGRLDSVLATPVRPPRVPTPSSTKFAAILTESNPVELQRQLLTSTVQNQVLCERLRKAADQRTVLLERIEREREMSDDLKFRLDEKSIELEGARARVRQLERDSLERSRSHSSMREMQPLHIPDEEIGISETPRRRPSRIPQPHAKGAAPRPPSVPSRPPSAHSVRSARLKQSAVPVRRSPASDKRVGSQIQSESLCVALGEYVARTERLAPLFPRLRPLPDELRLAYDSPQNLAIELTKSILYEDADSIDVAMKSHDSLWNGRPQQYFESMNYAGNDYDSDSLAP